MEADGEGCESDTLVNDEDGDPIGSMGGARSGVVQVDHDT